MPEIKELQQLELHFPSVNQSENIDEIDPTLKVIQYVLKCQTFIAESIYRSMSRKHSPKRIL